MQPVKPVTLHLTGNIHVAPTADELYDDLAHALVAASTSAVDERGVFHLALSGGSTPERFYMRLVMDTRYRVIPWKQTHLWIVDERRVPPDDEKSNFRMISETLADHIPTRRRQIHPMPATHDDAAGIYENELRRAFGRDPGRTDPPALDFVLLGMGEDGHTASLFPQSPALNEKLRWIAINTGPAVTPPDRVTMTFPLLNRAREIAVLVTGAKKSEALRRVDARLHSNGPEPQNLPITGIDPEEEQLIWYLDAEAAE